MTILETALIAGTDVRTVPGLIFQPGAFADLDKEAPLRGGNLLIPGRKGQAYVPKVADSYTIEIPVTIMPDAVRGVALASADDILRAYAIKNLEQVRALMPAAAFTLTHRRPTIVPGEYEDRTCLAEYVPGMAIEHLTKRGHYMNTVLQFVNLDGGWTAVP